MHFKTLFMKDYFDFCECLDSKDFPDLFRNSLSEHMIGINVKVKTVGISGSCKLIAVNEQASESFAYGFVDLFGGGRSAGYTGVNCLNYKNHILGPTYAIQGNILSGQPILDSMRARFLRQSGTLADKLMAALQGANVIGADTRCASWNTSSKSAFIRVAKPGDTLGTLYLNLRVLNAPIGREPIDSLQVLYNQWITTGLNPQGSELPSATRLIGNYPNPFNPTTSINFDVAQTVRVTLKIYDLSGREVAVLVDEYLSSGRYAETFDARGLASGIYLYSLTAGEYSETRRMALIK